MELVGRDAEWRAVETWLATRDPRVLLVHGEAGIGKTTLWDAGVGTARGSGDRVLAHTASWSEAQLSFTALRDLLAGVYEDVAESLPPPQRHALDVILLLSEPGGTAPQPGEIAVAFLSALRALGEREPLVLAVDDIQWLDTASIQPLAYALRRLDGTGVSALLARRDGVAGGLVVDDHVSPERLTLEVGPLSLGAFGRVLHDHLATAYPRPTLHRLHSTAGGNPFYGLELGRALQRRGGRLHSAEPIALPESLQGVVSERLAACGSRTRAALAAAAALAAPTLSLVGERGALDEAADAGLVELDGDRVRFTHPLYAAGAYSAAGAQERRALHARLAVTVADAEERARHLALSTDGHDATAATALEEAAGAAAGRGASATAAELAEQALRLTPVEDLAGRCSRAIAAGWYAFIAGDAGQARALLEQASATAPSGGLHARALVRLAWLDHHAGDRRLAIKRYRSALDEAAGDTALEAEAHCLLAWCVFIMREHVPLAAHHARTAVDLAERLGDPVLLTDSLAVLGQIEFFAGGGLPSPTMERALATPVEPADGRVLRQPRQHWAILLLDADRFDEARGHLLHIHELALEHGDESALPWPLMRLSQLALLAGGWEKALAYADSGLEAALQTGQQPPQADLLCTRALVLAHLGRAEEARATATEGLALARSCGAGIGRRIAVQALGLLDLSLGDVAAVRERLAALRVSSKRAGIVDPGENRYLGDLGESLVALGRVTEAELLATELEELGTSLGRASALAVAWRLRGLVALEAGDVDDALSRLEHALEHHAPAALPFEEARTLLALGSAQRRARRRKDARSTLTVAAERFDALGAELWTAKAQAELGRIGGRAPSPDGLTPTESRIADLVSQGLSNKEVAATLVVSVHTVESALTSIYRKLDVRSRTELASKLTTGLSKH
jgi:DNA-binding CsgD family transcriptional regulator/Tfp pilus assembly protein PilF